MSDVASAPADGAVQQVDGGLDDPTGLEPDQGTLRLAGPDAHTRADWEKAAAGVLRKARRLTDDDADDLVWARLSRTTLDGIAVTPLGTTADLEGLTTSGRPDRVGAWDVRSYLTDAPTANADALGDLAGGVTSLWLRATGATDLAAALDGVLLDLAPVVLEAPEAPVAAAQAFLTHLGGTTPAAGTNLGADPLDAALRAGSDTVDLDALVAVARLALDAGVLGVVVDATAAHDLGASDAQELGWSMAVAAAYLRALERAGIGVADAATLLEFRYAATDEQFPTIAKLRAARRLWARLLELSGATAIPQRQHAVTSRPMLSAYDPHVNLLRTTVAAFAAGVGGADAVTVLPFDAPLGRADAFSRRIARNTSHLLVSESHLARVADPAGGAYAVERLTDDLAAAAWAELDRLETSGGALAALADGSFRARLDETGAARERLVATRRQPITGLTEFPSLDAVRPEREADPLTPLVRRYGASFEAMRDDPPSTPVFLATLGTVAQHTARATFAANLLAAGGIAVDVAGATDGPDAVVAAHSGTVAKATVAVLAGSDAAYGEWGEQAAQALRDAGVTHVVVAGKPVDWADDSCAMGVDALAFLTRTREKLS